MTELRAVGIPYLQLTPHPIDARSLFPLGEDKDEQGMGTAVVEDRLAGLLNLGMSMKDKELYFHGENRHEKFHFSKNEAKKLLKTKDRDQKRT